MSWDICLKFNKPTDILRNFNTNSMIRKQKKQIKQTNAKAHRKDSETNCHV